MAGQNHVIRSFRDRGRDIRRDMVQRQAHRQDAAVRCRETRIVQIPAGRQIFSTMSVLDNLKVGAHLRRDRAGTKRDLESSMSTFQYSKKGNLKRRTTERRPTADARGRPSAHGRSQVALDGRPSIGLSPILVAEVGKIIKDINSRVSASCSWNKVRMALQLATRAYILVIGKICLQWQLPRPH